MMDYEAGPHDVRTEGGKFHVRDEQGRVIMVCRDEGSAVNYSVLLNEAYRRGYRAGYRTAREGLRKRQGK